MVRREVDILYDPNVHEEALNLPENNLTEREIKETIVEKLKERFSL